MEPEQPGSTPQSRRRWYQGLGRKLKQKILKPVDSGPARAREPSLRPASPGSYHTASGALQVTLQGLQRSADLVPPLRPAIEGLASFLGLFEVGIQLPTEGDLHDLSVFENRQQLGTAKSTRRWPRTSTLHYNF